MINIVIYMLEISQMYENTRTPIVFAHVERPSGRNVLPIYVSSTLHC